jgi:hypothetical protein
MGRKTTFIVNGFEFTLECMFTVQDTRVEVSILLPSDLKDQLEGSKWEVTEQGKTGWILVRHQVVMDRVDASYEIGSAVIYEMAKSLATSRAKQCENDFLTIFERVYEQRSRETKLAVRYDIWELLMLKKSIKPNNLATEEQKNDN